MRLAREEEEKRTANQSGENLVDRIGTPSHKSDKVLEPQKSTADPSQKQLSRADFNKSTAEAFMSTQSTLEVMRDRIDNDFKPVIIQLWKELSFNYKN